MIIEAQPREYLVIYCHENTDGQFVKSVEMATGRIKYWSHQGNEVVAYRKPPFVVVRMTRAADTRRMLALLQQRGRIEFNAVNDGFD